MATRKGPTVLRQVTVGSNVFINTPAILHWEGQPQIQLEIGRDNQLLQTMDVYDATGRHIAKLRRNAWAFNDDEHSVMTNPADLRLFGKASKPLVAAHVVDKHTIVVDRGQFFTPTGQQITITPRVLQIDTISLSKNLFEGGRGIFLDRNGNMGIG